VGDRGSGSEGTRDSRGCEGGRRGKRMDCRDCLSRTAVEIGPLIPTGDPLKLDHQGQWKKQVAVRERRRSRLANERRVYRRGERIAKMITDEAKRATGGTDVYKRGNKLVRDCVVGGWLRRCLAYSNALTNAVPPCRADTHSNQTGRAQLFRSCRSWATAGIATPVRRRHGCSVRSSCS
jgi:hypothetical protein